MSLVAAVAVALLVLVAPGLVVLRVVGRRGWGAWAPAPALSTALVLLAGGLCRVLRLDAVHLAGAGALVVVTVGTALLARLLNGRVDPEVLASGWRSRLPLLPLGVGALTLASVLGRAVGDPRAWPQIHDTVFHVGTTTWLVRHGSAWVGDVSEYARIPYPGGWHALTAVVSGLSGAEALVASHAVVLVLVALVGPLGLVHLARTVLGEGTAAGVTAACAALLFYALPYQLLTWGVVWPFLLASSLVPSVLALAVRLVDGLCAGAALRRTLLDTVLLVAATGAATLAHPSVLYGLLLVGGPLLVSRLRSGRRRRLARVTAVAGVLAALLAWSMRPPARLLTAGSGKPEYGALDVLGLVLSTVSLHPVSAAVGTLLVALGCAHAVRTGRAWLAWGVLAPLVLASAVLLLPHSVASLVAWPWYSDVNRIRTLSVVPAVLAVALVPAALADLSVALRRVALPATAALAAVLALLTLLAAAPVVHARYHPTTAEGWWATPAERDALDALGREVPPGSVVAADPFRGGTFLYLHRPGTTLLFPVADPPPDATPGAGLLASSLDALASDPEVCRAARAVGLTHVVTGGDPNADAAALGRTYDGVERVAGASAGFTRVASRGPYTLWALGGCTS